MADFRKWFLAFAVVALLFAIPASAQPALQCTANAGVPPTVRAEGITELVGDIVLNCTGGTSTTVGSPIPQANVTVFLSTNITSRLVADPMTEALLLIDEPHSIANPLTPLNPCTAGATGTCSVNGTGGGVGLAGPYNGSAGHQNVFQGRLTGANQVTFLGVPIDPPGTNTRVIRVTNIRGNANQLGVSSTLVPTQITAYISITGSTSVPVNNPQQTVAFVQKGLNTSIQNGTLSTPISFLFCNPANKDIAGTNTKALNTGTQNGTQFLVRFDEGFASSWKVRNYNLSINPSTAASGSVADTNQSVPGAIYNTETGFFAGTTTEPALPGVTAFGGQFPTTSGLSSAGRADAGTRLMINFNAVPTGAQLFVPVLLNTVNQSATGTAVGKAVLVASDASGANIGGIGTGSFGPIPASSTSTSNVFSGVSGVAGNTGVAPVTVTAGTATAVYEIVSTDPFTLERLEVPVAVAFTANQTGLTLGTQSTLSAGFAPTSAVVTASATAPIPRFAPGSAINSFIVNRCACNVLFPFVSNQAGFDTGIAISNTSMDPFTGTTTQTGTVTINYYSGGTPVPPQTTNGPIPAGQTLAFTLGTGGNFGIAATPGFQGYIIAQSQFQFCHALAYISAAGNPFGGAMGYLGIVLDSAGLNRTGSPGEVQAH